MANRVKLLTSTCGTAAFEAVVDAYRCAIADGRGAESILILPTHLLAARITEQLLSEQDNGVLLSPNILTFASLAERILTANAADARHIGIVARQELVRTVIAEQLDADRLEYFRPIASTPGFRRSMMGLISELKRAEIFPQQLNARIDDLGSDAPERQLANLYATYQNHLQQRNLYDAEGRFWNAKRVLAEANSKGPVEPLDLLAIAGFTDFTGAQIDILRLLADRSGRTLLSLPLTEDAREEDLFDTPRLTLSRIEAAMPGRLDRTAISETDDRPAALAHVRDHLFGITPVAAPKERDAIELIEEAGLTAEIEQVATRIKRRIASGQWLTDDLLVVCRDLPGRREQIAEVFTRYGVPFQITAAPPLSDSPPVRYLLRWVQLLIDDMPRRSLVALLASRYFHAPPSATPFDDAIPAEVEWVTREAGILRGRQNFLERLAGHRLWLERRAESSTADPDEMVNAERRDMQLASLRRAEDFLAGLWEWLEQMPTRGSVKQFATVLGQWASDLQLAASPGQDFRDERSRLTENAALARFADVLSELANSTSEVDLAEFYQRINEAVAAVSQPDLSARSGGVTITDALTARSLSTDVVIVMGLAEGQFPRPAPQSILLSDDARRRADGRTGLLADRGRQSRAEMFLFHQVITRARRQLVLSFASTDGAGREILPSPYLDELGRLFEPEAALPWGLPHVAGQVGRIVAPLDELASAGDLPLAAAVALWPDAHNVPDPRGGAVLAALLEREPAVTRNWLAGIGAELERQDGRTFSAFDGRLNDPRILEQLTAEFPARRRFSAGQLELYAACPMAWFFRYILHVEPIESPDERIDVKQIGLLAHAVLRQFYLRMGSELGTTNLADERLDPDRVSALMSEVLAARLAAEQVGLTPAERALWEIQGRRLGKMLDRYLDAETDRASNAEGIEPVHFEVSFGLPIKSSHADSASTTDPLRIDAPEGMIELEGRIDRIDRIGGGEGAVGIVDYKTGSRIAGPKDVLRGEAFQLPLYMLAAQRLLIPCCDLDTGVFWSLSEGKAVKAIGPRAKPPKEGKEPVEWDEMILSCLDHVRDIVAGIREGRFILWTHREPPTFPRFRHAMRYSEVRLSGKTGVEGGAS